MNYRKEFCKEPGRQPRRAEGLRSGLFRPRRVEEIITEEGRKAPRADGRVTVPALRRSETFVADLCASTRRSEVVIFNRSHYEDVLIVRVHDLVPKNVWSNRYKQTNDFERRLVAYGTHILKFFHHISKKEQLERFKDRLEDPERKWKISEADYTERKHWADYGAAYEDALIKCITDDAPWFGIPSDHKRSRNLAISQIIVQEMEKTGIKVPQPTVNITAIHRKYHEAVERAKTKKTGDK